ncbi:MAG: double-strand break repair helicase AddA [Hyphomonadaceae bacterium]
MNAYERAAQSQQIAADPAYSVFVTANAGSGKTKVLIDRIARLLLKGVKPSSFLCITYTKAAAAEMQRRLFDRLGAWCVAADGDLRRELEALTGAPLDDATVAGARALFARALESPGGLKIQTIHAFCERLLARFPLEAGVPPGFEIADDVSAREMLAQAWRAAVLSGEADVSSAITRFGARLHDDRFRELLNLIVQQRGEMAGHARDAIKARHDAGEPEAVVAGVLAEIDWHELQRARDALAASSARDQAAALKIEAALSLKEADSGAALVAWAEIFLTDKHEPRKDAPTKKLARAEPWLETFFSQGAAKSLSALRAWKTAERAADSAAAVALAQALDQRYRLAKARSGALDFADLIERANALLTSAEAAAWVLFKLDGGIDHILIDEGQDTSPTQWALIEPLQTEFFAGEGAREEARTVFAVGDPKQSIYSFQGADPQRFRDELTALDSRAHAAGKRFISPSLEMSFRSTREVLRVVDAAFADLAVAGDVPGAFDAMRHDAKRDAEEGRVEWWPLAPRPARAAPEAWDAPLDMEPADSSQVLIANALAAEAKRWIGEKQGVWDQGALRPMQAGDILILVRSRGQLFRQLIKAFKRAGLPVAGADRMILKDEIAVEDCLTLMRVAADPEDDYSLACLLKSPWLGLTDDDADIFPLAWVRAKGETLLSRLLASNDGKYAEAQDFVRALTLRGAETPDRLLAWALERLDAQGRSGWEKLFTRLGPESRDPVEELLARALNANRRGPATLVSFLAQIERDQAEVKREMEEAGGAVRIMTVHGAKGLEAPVVILPDMSQGPKLRPSDPDLFMTEAGPVFSANKQEDDPVSAAARAAWETRNFGEYLRLLYVAMTRPRDRLILCGYADGRYTGGAQAQAWHQMTGDAMARIGEEIDTPFGKGFALGRVLYAESKESARERAHPLPAWAKRVRDSVEAARAAAPSQLKKEGAALSPRGDGTARFRRGLLLHGLLQRLPEVEPPRRAEAGALWLKRQGVENADMLVREALAVIDAPAFAHVFGQGSRAEAPIVGRIAGLSVRGIVDRLVVSDHEVEIIDFKSDRPAPETAEEAPEGYVLQMALYRAVLQQIFPNRGVKCALIWTEKPLLVALSGAQMDAALAGLTNG